MPDFRPLLNLTSDRLRALPLVVLYLTDGCNSRCVTCDIWKLPRRNMSMDLIGRLSEQFPELGVRQVVLSGGEAMQHPAWPEVAARFRAAGAKVTLLTNGLLLKKQAQAVIDSIDQLTVSLDGGNAETYQRIRGVDGFELILEGMRQCSAAGVPITSRTTLQRDNYREMAQIVSAARSAGVSKVSFLTVDISSREAFGPRFEGIQAIEAGYSAALRKEDLPIFRESLETFIAEHSADFASGMLAESPTKLRRLYDYFASAYGLAAFTPPRCNAPHLSTVIEVDGQIRPCFFLPTISNLNASDLLSALNDDSMVAMRAAYRSGERSECARCVCPLYQGPRALLRTGVL